MILFCLRAIMSMLRAAILISASLAVFFPFSAHSQGMPPPAHFNSPYYVPPGAQSGNGYTPQPRTIILPDQWGAIVADVKGGVLGVSTHASSERASERIATRECKNKGGHNCKVMLTYMNQCAVLVIGSDLAIADGGLTIEAASEKALNECKADDYNCRVYYSACSIPRRPQ